MSARALKHGEKWTAGREARRELRVGGALLPWRERTWSPPARRSRLTGTTRKVIERNQATNPDDTKLLTEHVSIGCWAASAAPHWMRRADRLCVASLTLYFVRQRPDTKGAPPLYLTPLPNGSFPWRPPDWCPYLTLCRAGSMARAVRAPSGRTRKRIMIIVHNTSALTHSLKCRRRESGRLWTNSAYQRVYRLKSGSAVKWR